MVFVLLAAQVFGAIIALKKDFNGAFSQINKITKMAKLVPHHQKMITDFWCLNYVVAAIDMPVYCIGFESEKQFLQWDKTTVEITKQSDLYLRGINDYLLKTKKNECYFISTTPLPDLIKTNNKMAEMFDIKIIDEEVGTIEKYSNLYLYKFAFN